MNYLSFLLILIVALLFLPVQIHAEPTKEVVLFESSEGDPSGTKTFHLRIPDSNTNSGFEAGAFSVGYVELFAGSVQAFAFFRPLRTVRFIDLDRDKKPDFLVLEPMPGGYYNVFKISNDAMIKVKIDQPASRFEITEEFLSRFFSKD